MNAESIKAKWPTLEGLFLVQWDRLKPGDIANIAGERDKLLRRIEELYGYPEGRAEKAVDEWIVSIEARTRA